jgi:hypothetical protein
MVKLRPESIDWVSNHIENFGVGKVVLQAFNFPVGHSRVNGRKLARQLTARDREKVSIEVHCAVRVFPQIWSRWEYRSSQEFQVAGGNSLPLIQALQVLVQSVPGNGHSEFIRPKIEFFQRRQPGRWVRFDHIVDPVCCSFLRAYSNEVRFSRMPSIVVTLALDCWRISSILSTLICTKHASTLALAHPLPARRRTGPRAIRLSPNLSYDGARTPSDSERICHRRPHCLSTLTNVAERLSWICFDDPSSFAARMIQVE